MAIEDDPASNATAQTLNYALGNLGGRQKSWMQAANPSAHLTPSELATNPLPFTVRRRGRPPKMPAPTKVPVPRPPPTLAARPTVEPQAETQPPSNSTSPQLANIISLPENANAGASMVTVFPSPTPSEENNSIAPPPASLASNGIRNLDFLELRCDQAADAPNTPLETVNMHDAPRASNGTKRLSMDAGAHAQKRVQHVRPSALASTTDQRQQSFSRFAYPDSPRHPSTPQAHNGSPQIQQTHTRRPSLGQLSNGQAPSPRIQQAVQALSTGMTPHQARAPCEPPRTWSHGSRHSLNGVAPATPNTVNAGYFQTPQFVNLQPTWYTRQECMKILTSFQASFAVDENHERDPRRINVLKDAADRGDWPFLIMHQLYCLLDFNQNLVPAVIRSKPGLNKALSIMHEVLDSNKKLSPAVLHFFSGYPYHLEVIRARWPAGFREQIEGFLQFAASSTRYDALQLTCTRRRFPPVTWELVHYLNLESTTFQRLLFTAILRRIWRGAPRNNVQHQFEAQAVSLFQQNQAIYYQRIARQSNGQYPTQTQVLQDREAELRHWGFHLKLVVEELEATLRQQSLSGPSPSPSHIISPNVQQAANAQHQQQHQQLYASEADMASSRHRVSQAHSAQATIQQGRVLGRPGTQAIPPVPASHILPINNQQQQGRELRLPQQQYRRHQQELQQAQQHRQQLQQVQQQRQPQQLQQQRPPGLLLPPAGWVQPQQREPNPAKFSLHQAYLRSPVLQAREADSPLYHFVQGFIKPPARLTSANVAIEKWTFNLNADMMSFVPTAVPTVPGGPDCKEITTKNTTVRLRCVKWSAAEMPNEHIWTVTDTSWIPYSYFTFNGTSLQQRKKIHHGKDQPVDITGLLKEGENILEMTVMSHSSDRSFQDYVVAIEVLGFNSHNYIKQYCLEKSHIPAQQVIGDIKRRLAGNSEDDELAIVESNLTIDIFDPFRLGKMCDIPVRGRSCLHNSSFDLDTFLVTRKRKGDVSVPDLWRCPICNADARPFELVVDGFLQEVKETLDAQGRSKTRAIIVYKDGSWKPKAEVREGVSDDPPTPTIPRPSIPPHAEIIDLSD